MGCRIGDDVDLANFWEQCCGIMNPIFEDGISSKTVKIEFDYPGKRASRPSRLTTAFQRARALISTTFSRRTCFISTAVRAKGVAAWFDVGS